MFAGKIIELEVWENKNKIQLEPNSAIRVALKSHHKAGAWFKASKVLTKWIQKFQGLNCEFEKLWGSAWQLKTCGSQI